MFFPNDFKYEHDIIRRGLYGLLLGDTVGRSYEFKSDEELLKFLKIDMVPPINQRTAILNRVFLQNSI